LCQMPLLIVQGTTSERAMFYFWVYNIHIQSLKIAVFEGAKLVKFFLIYCEIRTNI
jgi:hypothetical protein